MRIGLLFALLFSFQLVSAQLVIKKDLNQTWLMHDSSAYQEFNSDGAATTVYFNIPVKQFKTDYLIIESQNPVSILLNDILLLDDVRNAKLSIDSLSRNVASTDFFIAIHSTQPLSKDNLTTYLAAAVLYKTTSPEESYLKTKTVFRDFTITALLIMIIFLVSIIRLNPGLSSDYFSIRKIFSYRESEDDHYYYRVTSGTILFYVFTSLMVSLYLMIVVRFTDVKLGMQDIMNASYGMLIFIWLKIGVYILLFLFAKIVVIYLVSLLFGIREIAGYHFFNFVRILLVTIGLLSLVLLIYFILHGQGEAFYKFLYGTIPWILGVWIILGFFKLASRVRHSAFHLFSYICATELIPFFIIIEVLNK